MLVNLAIVLAGDSSTRRRALDVDDSLHALNCLVTAPIAGALFAGASVFLFSRTSFYSATVHQFTTVVFLTIAFIIDTVPRVVYAESDAEPPEGGLCNVTGMELAEVVSVTLTLTLTLTLTPTLTPNCDRRWQRRRLHDSLCSGFQVHLLGGSL